MLINTFSRVIFVQYGVRSTAEGWILCKDCSFSGKKEEEKSIISRTIFNLKHGSYLQKCNISHKLTELIKLISCKDLTFKFSYDYDLKIFCYLEVI